MLIISELNYKNSTHKELKANIHENIILLQGTYFIAVDFSYSSVLETYLHVTVLVPVPS